MSSGRSKKIEPGKDRSSGRGYSGLVGSTMKMCSGCRRHLMAPEPRCPFCGAALPTSTSRSGRGGPAIMLGVSIMLGSAGCGPGITVDLDPTGSSGPVATTVGAPPPTTSGDGGPMPTSTTEPPGEVSSGTDESSDGVDDEDDFGCGFYAGCIPDGGSVTLECDLFAQDCPEGEKCMPWANDGGALWNATRCSPVDDSPANVGEPCQVEGSGVSGIDDCDLGQMCWGVDPETNQGLCEAMCTGDEANPMCEDPDRACMMFADGSMSLCLPPCDPVLQSCAPGQGCFPVDDSFYCFSAVVPEAGHADPCDFWLGCAPGQVCIGGDSFPDCGEAGCCSTVCNLDDVDADAGCAMLAEGQQCQPWYAEGMAPLGFEHVGVCALPS